MESCLGNCVGCLKVNHSLFNDLSEKELKTLNQNRKKFHYKKEEVLYHEGEMPEGLICLNHGKVKLVKEGKIENEFIVGLHKTVDFIGFDDLMGKRRYTSTAIALEDTFVCVIAKENLFKVIMDNIDLALKIIQDLSERAEFFREKLLVLTQSKVENRLAFTLNELISFYGFKKDGKTIAVQLKRREIAAMSNMNTANVIRTLAKFKDENIIEFNKKEIIILQKEQLLKLV